MAFQCTLVTPEQQALDADASQVILPAHDGLIGILSGRAPLLVKLGVGPLRIDLATGEQRFFFVDGGVAQMKDNRLTILTTQAVPADQISFEAAQEEYARALAAPIPDAKAYAERQHHLDRARAQQAMARR